MFVLWAAFTAGAKCQDTDMPLWLRWHSERAGPSCFTLCPGPRPLTPVCSAAALLWEKAAVKLCLLSWPKATWVTATFWAALKFCLVISGSDAPYALPSVVCVPSFKEICRPFWTKALLLKVELCSCFPSIPWLVKLSQVLVLLKLL